MEIQEATRNDACSKSVLEAVRKRRSKEVMQTRDNKRHHHHHLPYGVGYLDNNKQITHFSQGNTGEVGLVARGHTSGHILCCDCGILIPPNDANKCARCLILNINIKDVLPSHGTIIHCPGCKRYLQPPTTWMKVHRDSNELLSLCLNRLKNLRTLRLVNAKFVFTEEHSKRIKLQLTVQKEIDQHQSYAEKSHLIEYVVVHRQCPSCLPADPNNWEANVQVRQQVSHMRTFFFLEQLIIKHQAATLAVKIKQERQGIDFFFAKKRDAVKFFDFLCKVVPVKQANFNEKLVSHNSKSNISRYRFNIVATICPICRDDLIFLPTKLSASFGQLGPLVICSKVRNTITLLDPLTLREHNLSADLYWRQPFEPVSSIRQLVEYVILDVEVIPKHDSKFQKYVLAEVQIARVSDFGRNDTIFCVKTHLGHLLKPGDYALGYDLIGANINCSEAEKCKASFPDAVLIKKKQEEKHRKKFKKATSRISGTLMETESRSSELERTYSEYEQFVRDLEDNPESRFNISLQNCSVNESSQVASATTVKHTSQSNLLEDVFADLDLSDNEDGDPIE